MIIERLVILAKWITALPPNAVIHDQHSIDLIGEYYYQQIAILLGQQWNLKDYFNNRSELPLKAISFFVMIPKDAKRRRDACHIIATHIYQLTLEQACDEIAAFVNANPIFMREHN